MTTEIAGRSELAQLVTHHILGYVYGNELISVVDSYRLTDEVRRNHTCARPSLDDSLLVPLGLCDYLRLKFGVDEWSWGR